MLTSRGWIISSGLVGAISLMLRTALNFSVTGARFSLPTLNPLFIIINGIIFALAASASLFGQEAEHHHDDDHYHYEHDHHDHNDNHNHEQDHERSYNNSSDSSFDQYNKKGHEEEKFPVRSESGGGSYVVRPPVSSRATAPEKPTILRRPPTAPLKTFPQPQDDKSGDEDETMEEMWNRVKAEKQPTKPDTWQIPVISRNESRMSTRSTTSCPSPSRVRRHPPSPGTTKVIERIPTWVKLKKELSMGRDELNSRVEAFIRNFKDEMKLQRVESIRRYKLFRRRSDDK